MEPFGAQALPFSSQSQAAAANRRRSVRQRVHTPAYASLRGKSSAIVLDLNEVLDISEQGLSFQGPAQLEFGRSLEFNLDLSETNAYLPTTGRVVWSEPAGRTGVSFVRMSGPSLLRLKQWLFVNMVAACGHYLEAREQEVAAEPAQPEQRTEHAVARQDASVQSAYGQSEGQGDAMLSAVEAVQYDVEQMGPDLNAALQLVAERALTLTGAGGAAIAVSEGEEMVCRGSAGADAPGLGARLQVGSGFSGECVRTGLFLTCNDSETDSRVDRDSCRALGVRSLVAAPVLSGQNVIGLLEVFSPNPGAFGGRERLALQHLTYIILAAVQRAVDALAARSRLSEAAARFAEAESLRLAPANSAVEEAPPPSTTEFASGGWSENQPPLEAPEEPLDAPRSRLFSVTRVLLLVVIVVGLAALAGFLTPSVRGRLRARFRPNPANVAATPRTASSALAAVSDLPGLQRLAELGDPTAQFALGAHYATGDGVPQDYTQAEHWFSLAAEQGHVVAQATLGAYYWAGRGVPQDLSKAYFWSILAQAGGDEASKYRVEALASRLTRAEIVAAQEQANEWLAQHELSAKSSQTAGR